MIIGLEAFSILSTIALAGFIYLTVKMMRKLSHAQSKSEIVSREASLNGQRFDWLFDKGHSAFCVINSAGRMTRVNPAWKIFFNTHGVALEEFKRSFNVFDKRYSSDLGISRVIDAAFKDGVNVTTLPTPMQRPLPSGELELFWVAIEYRPILLSGSDKVEEVMAIMTDFTEHRRATKASLSTRSIFAGFLDNSQSMAFVKDIEGRYLHLNQKWSKTWGIAPENAIGKTATEVFGHKIAMKMAESDAPVFRGLRREAEEEINGMWFHVVKFPIFDHEGHVNYIAGLATDITESKRAGIEREELLVREKTALEASRMKSAFLANMSHELRTPIHGIMGMADLLDGTELGGMQKDYTDSILKSADSLLTLVNDILDLSKAEAGKIEIETVDLSLKKVVEEVERTVRSEAWKKGISVKFEIDEAIPTALIGDPTRIRQVLMNLVSNAVKFTDKGSVMTNIHLGGGNKILFEILDSGIGISEMTMSKLFSAFTQADASTTRRYGGTGLGLSISKHLVELMGGEIGADRRKPEGTRFWFTIPLQVKQVSLTDTIALQPTFDDTSTKPLRILVAEDNSTNQMIITATLKNLGHTSVLAGNGKEALVALGLGSFDLILMDCQMPIMDGFEATRLIREGHLPSAREIPIIALTANAMRDDMDRCLAAGMSDYVSKPAKTADIRSAIGRVMSAATRAHVA